MSDQLTLKDGSTVAVTDLDPAIVAHFATMTKGLEAKRDELLGTVNNLKAFKAAIDEIGGIDALKALQSNAAEATSKAEKERLAKLSADERLAEIEAKYKSEIDSREQKLSQWRQRAVDREVMAMLNEAIRAEDGVPELLAHTMRGRLEAEMGDDGEIKVTVKGPAGENLDSTGKPFTLKGLVGEFKANNIYAGGFKAAGVNGAGGRKTNSTNLAGDNPFAKNTFNATKQMELIRSAPDTARSLATAAGVEVDW